MYGDLLNTIGFVETADPEVGEAMELELKRQRRNLELIASENIVSPPLWLRWARYSQTNMLRATRVTAITAAVQM